MTSGFRKVVCSVLLVAPFIPNQSHTSIGKITCFRKLKRNGKCAGIVRKGTFHTQEDCCSKWSGYALKKTKVGKNRFKCEPCQQNEVFPQLTRRPKVKKVKPRKERKPPKKEKVKERVKEKVTEAPKIVKPIVEFKPKESWHQPSKRTEISYSYIKPEKEKVRWGPWSPCSASCGAGWRSRFRICDDCDKNDYENVQSQPCIINFYCPVDGNWGPWFPWQPCSMSCGGGTRVRQRKCNYPPPAYEGLNCQGPGEVNQTCNEKDCPVNGQWSSWSDFSLCSVTCGTGTKRKTRSCDSPAPANGGRAFYGTSMITKKCQNPRCPQHGGWTMWGPWSSCPVTCGRGSRTRTRACESPRPMYGGRECEGETVDTLSCDARRPCPVHGGWSEWTNFSPCNAERCQSGYQVRSRSCTDPVPRRGGHECVGDQYDRKECFKDTGCAVNGSWCAWSEWSKCTATCKIETVLRVRQRECKCPEPKNDGGKCEGEGIVVKSCHGLPSCPKELDEDPGHSGMEPSIWGDQEGDVTGDELGNGVDTDKEEEQDYPDHTVMEDN